MIVSTFAQFDWLAAGVATGLGTLAGGLGYAMRSMDRHRAIRPPTLITQAASSGLAGFLVLALCEASRLSQPLTVFAVGMSGWLGVTPTLQLLKDRFITLINPTGSRGNETKPQS